MNTQLLKKLNDESIDLASEVSSELARLYYVGETTPSLRSRSNDFRVTSQLAEVISWVMARRAVLAGELSESAAREIGGGYFHENPYYGILTARDIPELESSPGLSNRCRKLYQRVARLHAQLIRNS